MNSLNLKVKALAAELGFDDCRIALAKRATHADDFEAWIENGSHGDMQWLERNPNRRCDPREVLPGCKSVICLAVNYYTGDDPFPDEHPKNYRIAKYSWNDDYHDLIEKRLADFNLALVELGGKQRYYVDTGPILERDFATDSGLGWNGKSTVQIHRQMGTWFFLLIFSPRLISALIKISAIIAGNARAASMLVRPKPLSLRINSMLVAAFLISPSKIKGRFQMSFDAPSGIESTAVINA